MTKTFVKEINHIFTFVKTKMKSKILFESVPYKVENLFLVKK